ncbi:hypothetical protein J1605_011900 [Eschrichtius robustus]|uniref:Uncharacterized protein n=1 Tax=Eschrichtius robustus TaxID=9764 RepID=A0AB34GNS9_ESCRO|nr:hypothetical protein J1605_011900 [Eschrichtius robustus]
MGMAVNPQLSTHALEAAASISPDQKPTLNTPPDPFTIMPTLHPEGSERRNQDKDLPGLCVFHPSLVSSVTS